MQSGIDALIRFARRLKSCLRGILAHSVWPLHSGFLEGINNKIKVIKRIAHGVPDDAYFFLKIRAAFPVTPDEPNQMLVPIYGRPKAERPVSTPVRYISASYFSDNILKYIVIFTFSRQYEVSLFFFVDKRYLIV